MAPGLFSSWTSPATCDKPSLQAPSHKSLTKSLPAATYRSDAFFDLERRAIFSQTWILASHTGRFNKPGDFVSQEYAGFAYFIIKDKDGSYKAHHNVCRHRAFPVINSTGAGSVNIIACKYHSWSYRYDGSLVKAPKFETEPGFNKAENGLFPIHVHVNEKGFIFINFSSGKPVDFTERFGALSEEWSSLPVQEYEYAYSWEATGKFNWKTLIDGYCECYHCTVGHPGFAKSLDLGNYNVTNLTNYARHRVPNANGSSPDDGNPPTFTYTFPNTGVTTCPQMWYGKRYLIEKVHSLSSFCRYMMRAVPVDAHTTRLEYDVFRHHSMPMQELREFMSFYEQVEQEDYDLCEATQRGLEAGVYSKGTLHPQKENGVLYYQGLVADWVQRHQAAEESDGKEIHPARPAGQSTDDCGLSTICNKLNGNDKVLAW
ncbi:hypothetical protein EMMF5_003184 [Cystobasidiomycetes sp. EMM_F5]